MSDLEKNIRVSQQIGQRLDLKKRVLIIDGLNTYLRSYVINPSISPNGEPVGGLKGFLMSLQKYCRDIGPTDIVVVWDGPGGSIKKKRINRGYKEGRKPVRLNRNIRLLDEKQEVTNKIWQQTRLVQYLNEMPICQLMLENVEADDIISHVAQSGVFSGQQKVIISSDKDFLQCCDRETVLYRPLPKQNFEIMNTVSICENYKIHPVNIAAARALSGDKSDNLPGIPGVGLKTVAKKLPFLGESTSHSPEDVLKYCQENAQDGKMSFYKKVLDNEKTFLQNYKMMQLYAPNISYVGIKKVNEALNHYSRNVNRTEITKFMHEDGISSTDWTDLFITFNKIKMADNNG